MWNALDSPDQRLPHGCHTAPQKAAERSAAVPNVLDMSRYAERPSREDGFTVIELLVTVIIVGVVMAIAIPTFLGQNAAAADKHAHSDLRNAVTVLELCAVENGYPSSVDAVGVIAGCPGQRISLSDDTRLRYVPTGSPATSFVLATVNVDDAGGQVYCYNSADGVGSVVEVSGPLATATC